MTSINYYQEVKKKQKLLTNSYDAIGYYYMLTVICEYFGMTSPQQQKSTRVTTNRNDSTTGQTSKYTALTCTTIWFQRKKVFSQIYVVPNKKTIVMVVGESPL